MASLLQFAVMVLVPDAMMVMVIAILTMVIVIV